MANRDRSRAGCLHVLDRVVLVFWQGALLLSRGRNNLFVIYKRAPGTVPLQQNTDLVIVCKK